MKISTYFKNTKGTGILSTADSSGNVNAAVYASPHTKEDEEHAVSFIMRDRLSHKFLQTNPKAHYTFIENGNGYKGCRLVLTLAGEETDAEKIAAIRRRNLPEICREGEGEAVFLVHFRVDEVRPLVGPNF